MKIEEEYVRNVEKLVPCPEIALEVLSIAHESDCNIPKLSRKIEQDPNLTANMLRMANSAYFGHMKQINSITDIIVRLGLETVKLLAITSASVGLLRSPQKAYNLEPGALWRHSFATATLAAVIGRYTAVEDPPALYTAALLHDVGKVILNRPLRMEILNSNEPPPETMIIDYEREVLRTDHARVGAALLKKWGLPDSITGPVGAHHQTAEKPNDPLPDRVVRIANTLAGTMGFHSRDPGNPLLRMQELLQPDENWPEIPDFVENMERIIQEFFEKYNETSSIFFDLSGERP